MRLSIIGPVQNWAFGKDSHCICWSVNTKESAFNVSNMIQVLYIHRLDFHSAHHVSMHTADWQLNLTYLIRLQHVL